MPTKTIAYYDSQATEYASTTKTVDMSSLYAKFLPLLPVNAHILDAGCGSGRDAYYFKCHGFKVSAFDASSAMASIAGELLQQPVNVLKFEEFDEENQYDGIWCCASLLHVATDNLPSVFFRLHQALKPGAVLYASFKYGDGEREVNGRCFTDMNEEKLKNVAAKVSHLSIIKTWQTQDQRPERKNEVWFNALLTKSTE
ncbi:class I SAM-dependent methyltransferase [Rheinheimera sp. HH7-4]